MSQIVREYHRRQARHAAYEAANPTSPAEKAVQAAEKAVTQAIPASRWSQAGADRLQRLKQELAAAKAAAGVA